MLKTYEFWQLDEKFLVVSQDKKLFAQEAFASLPASPGGYLAYAYLDQVVKIAFLGLVDEDQDHYQFFDQEAILVIEAAQLPQLLVRLIKPTHELIQHPFVAQVLAFHAADALRRSTLALRALDPLRDPLEPGVLTAAFIRDEVRKEKAYEEDRQAYVEALEAVISSQEGDVTERLDALEKPQLAQEEINFIQIKDLMPANHGSWRAVLLDNLPGTRLKKKGDEVALSLVTVADEETSHSLLFVNHTEPVEGTDIKVHSYKPSRLPWRLAYELACDNCDFKTSYHLGRHGEDSYMYQEILNEIRQGAVDPLLLIDLVQNEDSELDFSRELYRCRNCGNLEVMKRLRLITPDKTLSAAYNCSNCGERMSQVKRGHIASLDCPDCRKPLNLVSEKQWSGVPDIEVEGE